MVLISVRRAHGISVPSKLGCLILCSVVVSIRAQKYVSRVYNIECLTKAQFP